MTVNVIDRIMSTSYILLDQNVDIMVFEPCVLFFPFCRLGGIEHMVPNFLIFSAHISGGGKACSALRFFLQILPNLLQMIMVNRAKSWLTMVPLSISWLIMIHGTFVKIMAESWQDHGKIMARSRQDNHGKTCKVYNCIIYSFHNNFLPSQSR